MRISDGSSDVCSSDPCTGERAILSPATCFAPASSADAGLATTCTGIERDGVSGMADGSGGLGGSSGDGDGQRLREVGRRGRLLRKAELRRSEEHTSELQSLMRISYADFGLKKEKRTSEHK